MNDKIKEFAKQAGASWYTKWDPGAPEPVTVYIYDKFDHDKFAELIINDCLLSITKQFTLDTNNEYRDGFSHGRKYAWTEIRNNYGIKR